MLTTEATKCLKRGLLAMIACCAGHAAAPEPPKTPTARAIMGAIDSSRSPEADFYRYALGAWQKKAATQLNEGRPYVDFSTEIMEDFDKTLESIFRSPSPQTPEGKLIAKMHRLLREGRRGQGLEPIRPLLDRILKARNSRDLSSFARNVPTICRRNSPL